MAERIRTHKTDYYRSQLGSVNRWEVPKEVKAEVRRFLEELALGKVNKGKQLSIGTQSKYAFTLKPALEFFNKPTAQISASDVEEFEKALSGDIIRKLGCNLPYSHSTKTGIRKYLKVYLRWATSESRAEKLAGWLDTRSRFKTPEYLSEQEVKKLLFACRTPEQRFIIAMLFDSGARAEEFINVRYEDVHLPEGKDNFAKVTLKEEYSKTQGRVISLYWEHTLQAVRDYLSQRVSQGIRAHEPVLENSYDGMRMFLRRLGQSVLKKPVHPHLFRHSSATYYATKLNRQELCYRYGWRFSSNMPDVYISRAGMEHKQLDEKFASTEITALKEDLAKMQLDNKMKDERLYLLERKIATIEMNFPEIAVMVGKNPSISQVESVLRFKQRYQPSHN